MSEESELYRRGWNEALAAVCAAYGGDPADPIWSTPEGIAQILEDYSGQARGNFVRGYAARDKGSNAPRPD